MQIEKPKLFLDSKQFLLFGLVCLLILLARIGLLYGDYQALIEKPFYYTYASVMQEYYKTKNSRIYKVLKLHSDAGFTFYTTVYDHRVYSGNRLRLQLFPNSEITFMAYLGTFYIKSKVKKVEPIPQTLKGTLLQEIDQQHSDEKMRSFYKAILFATPLDKNVRESVAGLGVSHLVALSGFHLAILWFTLYQLILFLYQPIQQRFFPYRWSLIDVGFVVMGLLGVYVWFVGAPPSLVRSYGMVLLGWLLVLMGVELLSFGFLYSVVLILLALFPALIVSIAFWFSVAGVHSIFLILQNSQSFHIKVVSFVVIPVGVFVLMLPISHTLFGMTTPYQLLSPVLSILFTFFYPLMIVLHLVGMGSIMDGQLPELLSLSCDMREELLPMEVIGLYVGIAFRAITSKKAFLLLVTLASLYGAYLYL